MTLFSLAYLTIKSTHAHMHTQNVTWTNTHRQMCTKTDLF